MPGAMKVYARTPAAIANRGSWNVTAMVRDGQSNVTPRPGDVTTDLEDAARVSPVQGPTGGIPGGTRAAEHLWESRRRGSTWVFAGSGRRGLRQERERFDVGGANDREVPPIEGGDAMDSEALGDGDDRRVGPAEAEVGIALGEVGHPSDVSVGQPRKTVNQGPSRPILVNCIYAAQSPYSSIVNVVR